MKEKRDFSLKRKTKKLTPEILSRILRSVTVESDASATYEMLTGEKIPEIKGDSHGEETV